MGSAQAMEPYLKTASNKVLENNTVAVTWVMVRNLRNAEMEMKQLRAQPRTILAVSAQTRKMYNTNPLKAPIIIITKLEQCFLTFGISPGAQ